MKSKRSYSCAGCKGQVAIPKGRRLPLDLVREHHDKTCPGKHRPKQ